MKNKIKIHDGIVGAVIFTSVVLGQVVIRSGSTSPA